jgi:hypothetical protein
MRVLRLLFRFMWHRHIGIELKKVCHESFNETTKFDLVRQATSFIQEG